MVKGKRTTNISAPVQERSVRSRVSQQDVPSASLEKALKVIQAIGDNYGYKPTSPLQVARALDMQPTSGPFRMITGASIAYGLSSGGYNAEQITIEPLGLKIVRPTAEGDELTGKREALLRPRVIREFLKKYDRAPLPRQDIAVNVLVGMEVPKDRAIQVLQLITESAESLGFIQEIKGRKYVDLSSIAIEGPPENQKIGETVIEAEELGIKPHLDTTAKKQIPAESSRLRRVFITHGKNRAFIEPIKKLLAFGELEAVVAVEKQTVSQPVPDKVMNDMRGCGAAIIHVEDELHLVDTSANAHIVLNPNVLIEIGAAMALYGRRFILLVKEGIKLPSNLQGLNEVRYQSDVLDGTATIKLLEAINDIKNHPLPGMGGISPAV